MPAIVFDKVTKNYSRSGSRLLLRHRINRWLGLEQADTFSAINQVSFSIDHGETVGVVGPNGAGKSTLLGLVAGVNWPDFGLVAVQGRIAALLDLGAGFHPDLTGLENLHLNASLLGMRRRDAAELEQKIIEFAELSEFIGEPLRTYSSGMILRLGFSIAVNLQPEILLVDEILAVGDQRFQAKCLERIHEIMRRGTTIVVVSHIPSLIRGLCRRVLWFEHGRLRMDGPVGPVLDAYSESVTERARKD